MARCQAAHFVTSTRFVRGAEAARNHQAARSVIAGISRTIKIRPAKHARDPAAFWQAGENTLFYTPGAYIPGSKLYSASPYLTGYTADAVLLHEVVHAMRTTQGHWAKDQEEIGKIHYPPWAGEGDPKEASPLSCRHLSGGYELTALVHATRTPRRSSHAPPRRALPVVHASGRRRARASDACSGRAAGVFSDGDLTRS